MSKSETREFIAEIEGMGLRVVQDSNSGHYKVRTPDGRWVMDFAHSSGDRHWQKQAKRRLRVKLMELYG